MGEVTFAPWPKTPHWFRDITVTEKLDGTNAAIQIHRFDDLSPIDQNHPSIVDIVIDVDTYAVFAQSRKRFLTPESDNFGFAAWVRENSLKLFWDLGTGTHYGEWWGQGIQRNYGQKEKYFSLFNTAKHGGRVFATPRLSVVPVLYQGMNDDWAIDTAFESLWQGGSWVSAPDWNGDPEGIIIYHSAANQVFKKTYVGDEGGKNA